MKRHDVYLAALAQRNRLRREAEEKSIEQQRKIERERGFSAYVNGANTRAKSATGPRTQSRISTASSSKSPEPKKPMTALGTSRTTRKSWAESMVQDKGPFFDKDDDSEEEEGIMYSETFDDDEHTGSKFEASSSSTPEMEKSSSIESVEERVHTPSSSREMVVPQLSARSGRRGWTLDSSIPFATLKVASHEFSDGSKSSFETASTASSPSPELGHSVSTGDALRAKEQRRNILQESWNLIDNFERKNKGRSSLIFSESFSENKPIIEEEEGEEVYSDFIPVTPSGQILDLIIHSTWGDQNYVGLNGLEVWNTKGEIVKVSSITSHDFRENALDPRSKLKNIINGNYNTSDDLHTWLAELPKTGRKSKVTLEFKRVQSIAMIRVWNYNRNRVHARRGVKHLELRLDQKVIFSNEIVCGQGDKSTPALEPIIFTTEEEVFNRIAQNDPVFPK